MKRTALLLTVGAVAVAAWLSYASHRPRVAHSRPAPDSSEDRAPDGTPLEHYAG